MEHDCSCRFLNLKVRERHCYFIQELSMKIIFLSTLTFLLCVHTQTFAQPDTTAQRDTVYYLSPFIVNPTHAKERETPATFSDMNAKQISDRYTVQDIPVVLSELPSMTSYSENGNGIGYSYINLRGFDQRRLSIMINGVPQNDPEDHNVYWIDVPDLMSSTDNIQVQRGAGSAFYGPPAIGGSINLVTNPFSREPGITIESALGFQETNDGGTSPKLMTRKYSASINSGIVNERYMLYGKLGRLVSDGYRYNSQVEMSSYFLGGLRLDPNMTTHFHIFGGPISDGLAYYGLPKFVKDDPVLRRENLAYWIADGRMYFYSQPRRKQEIEYFSQPHYEILHDWKIDNRTTLSNTIFYYTGDGSFDYDASWADTSTLRIGYNYGIPADQNPTNTLVRAYVGNRQWGWLPHIEFESDNNTLLLGTELRVHRSTHWGKIQFAEGLPSNFNPDYHFYEYNGAKDILSFYAHNLYRASEKITLMTDVQFVRNRYAIENEKYLGNTFSYSYFFANPRAGINYNWDEKYHGYFSIGYTSREPRLRNLYAAEDSYFGATPQFHADTSGGIVRYDFNNPIAKPERLIDIETGIRYRGAGGQFSINIFWMEFIDELVKSGQVDIFGQPVTGNAERTRHIGIELEFIDKLSEVFSVSGNLSLSRNRLIRYTVFNEFGTPQSFDGNPIAGFPDILGNIRCAYSDKKITLSILGKYVGSFYTDNYELEQNSNDAYTVFDGMFLYQLPPFADTKITLRAEVRNIFNTLYFSSGEGNAFFPAAERNYLFGIKAHF